MYLRITRGTFDPSCLEQATGLAAVVARAMERLPGLQQFFEGIDPGAGTLIAMSMWDTEEHARFPREALGDALRQILIHNIHLDAPQICEIDVVDPVLA